MGFFGIKLESPDQHAKPISLEKDYEFMYDNFVISNQQNLFVLLQEKDGVIDALNFEFTVYKYGYPNDEVGLLSKIPGIEYYEFCQVFNSKWVKELMLNNRTHTRHNDSLFINDKHFVIRFKDVTLEVIARKYDEVQLTRKDIDDFMNKEIGYIAK
ncbi:hypothetical protein [Flavobacterium sp.]|uniref:hypothetical protein n=1 Tax=Flavobacterium sp. TaxID=239 RepID=UPI0039E4C8EB